jgi:hypothetical protein
MEKRLLVKIENIRFFVLFEIKICLDYLNEPQHEGYPGYSSSSLASSFSISILFRNQRFRTRPFACAGEPYINQGFLLELHKDKQQGELSF